MGVRLGEYNTSAEIDCVSHGAAGTECNEPPITIEVEEEIPHENYSRVYKNDDIALIRLSTEINYTGKLVNLTF